MIKKEHSRKIVSYLAGLSDETYDVFMEFAIIKEYPKGKILIEHGKKNEFVFFLISGSAKSYNYKDSKQICLWFAFESDCIATIRSLDDLISQETVELLEDSELIQIKLGDLMTLSNQFTSISSLILQLLKEHILFLEYKLNGLQFMTSEERYDKLIRDFPEVLQRVSLTDIASYLGLSRETLSRIRRKTTK
ncbi:Crp/Fnr family transcriptional regulator [Schleiferiaceae bacterium]|jgi:CRP-like cAMP-binding protein|nr:Crp/Fnr family transcriptional regulator [Schleiferiaceae bacterium]